LRIVKEVERHVRDPMIVWCAPQPEEPLSTIEPRQGIALAVKHQELQLVCGVTTTPTTIITGTSIVAIGSSVVSWAATSTIVQRIIHTCEGQLQSNLLLPLLCQCHSELRHYIPQRLQGTQHRLHCHQATDNVAQGDFRFFFSILP
jgi:hypothetical protein